MQRLYVNWVQFGDGNVSARVHVQTLDEAGTVLANGDPITLVWPEADVSAKAVANGRADGQWGNDEVAQLLVENEIPAGLTVGLPGVPAQPAVVHPTTGEILRPAIAEIPASVRAPGRRFPGIAEIVWASAA